MSSLGMVSLVVVTYRGFPRAVLHDPIGPGSGTTASRPRLATRISRAASTQVGHTSMAWSPLQALSATGVEHDREWSAAMANVIEPLISAKHR